LQSKKYVTAEQIADKFEIIVRTVYRDVKAFANRAYLSASNNPKGIYETSFKSICNWVNRLNTGGVEALIDKEKPGRNSRLGTEQREWLKNVVMNHKPETYGYNSATWTGLLLIALIQKTHGVSYKKAQIYTILKSLGLSFQKGKGIYPETKDREEKVEAFKKNSKRKGQAIV
jgi:transposase